MEREVIVVGAGPAGATTAMALAQKGRDVLLIDRKNFPRDKVCGDGIPAHGIELLYSLGMQQKIAQANFYPVYKLLISSTKGGTFEADFHKPNGVDSYVVPRMQFDALLQQHALDSGAEFMPAQVVEPMLENGQVVGVYVKRAGKVEQIRSHLVVGADGVTSVIMRALRPKNNKLQDRHRAIAIRAYIEDLQELPHQIEFYLYKAILPGYAWIFPIGEGRANIGLGVALDKFHQKKRKLEEMLHAFLQLPPIQSRLKRNGQLHDIMSWQLTFGSQKNVPVFFNGALLVGDAAGFINPLTGGGILNAILSGHLASETIDDALRKGDVTVSGLKEYGKRCHDTFWSGMRYAYFFQRLLGTFPWVADILIRRMKTNSHFAQTFLTKL